jgi:hypothetical protein
MEKAPSAAEERNLRGRSRMGKWELIDAIRGSR